MTMMQKEGLAGGKRLDKVLADVRSGRQACGVKLAAQPLPRGGADTTGQVRPPGLRGKACCATFTPRRRGHDNRRSL